MVKKIKPTKRELQAIERLQKAIDKMPKTLWLFNTGQMHVMKYKSNGEAAETNRGGVDSNYKIAKIKGIYSEGGDW